MMTDTMRLELAPFNIKVIDLKTGTVKSGFFDNQVGGSKPSLPTGSIYSPAKDEIEDILAANQLLANRMDSNVWARKVVADLSGSSWLPWESSPVQIWKGTSSSLSWFARRFLPFTALDGELSKMGRLGVLKKKVKAQRLADNGK